MGFWVPETLNPKCVRPLLGVGFRFYNIWDLRFRVSGLGFRFYSIWDLGFRVSGLGFRFDSIWDLGFRV